MCSLHSFAFEGKAKVGLISIVLIQHFSFFFSFFFTGSNYYQISFLFQNFKLQNISGLQKLKLQTHKVKISKIQNKSQ